MKILFVCTGNTCRSPMAEGILRDLASKKSMDIQVKSAGIATFEGEEAALNSRAVMEEIGIDISDHRTSQVDQELIDGSDLILTMSNSHKESIDYQYSPSPDKLYTLLEYSMASSLDIKDPFARDIEVYRKTRDEIYKAVERLLERIENNNNRGKRKLKIGLASDHGGFDLKEEIKAHLENKGIDLIDYGTGSKESVDYPEYGKKAAKAVIDGDVDRAIVICGTGIGISLAANKVEGIRCALCSDTYSARMSREHNNANMLAMGGRVVGIDLAKEIVDVWLAAEFEGGRHERRVNKIE